MVKTPTQGTDLASILDRRNLERKQVMARLRRPTDVEIDPEPEPRQVIAVWDEALEEYRVPSPKETPGRLDEPGAYYTNDSIDAEDTAKVMYKGEKIRVSFLSRDNPEDY